MQYLKSFNESTSDYIKEECQEILFEISDYGIKVVVTNDEDYIDIVISDDELEVPLKKFKLTFEHLFSFLEENGFKLDESVSTYSGSSWDMLYRCPKCKSNKIVYQNSSGWNLKNKNDIFYCKDCKHESFPEDFGTKDYPLTKEDLFWSIKSGDRPNIILMSFKKS